MHSALYTGRVRHRRHSPSAHVFAYRLFMLYVDLDELDQAFRGRWLWSTQRPALAWWRRADFLGDANTPLRTAVADLVERETGKRPAGPIRMLTHLRYFGYSFNPVTFYYCFNEGGEALETIVAEITNTPWKERHAYVLGEPDHADRTGRRRYRFVKRFHVSPFIGMDVSYDWRLTPPGEKLAVHMAVIGAEHRMFDATLRLDRHPLSAARLAGALLIYPFMTLRIIGAIYWQALRLWSKGTPFIAHPKHPSVNPAARQETPP